VSNSSRYAPRMLGTLLGAIIGVIASLVAWWIIARALIPKLLFSPGISKIPETRANRCWRYRIKLVNARRWFLTRQPLIDVKVVATISIQGLDHDAPKNWINYNIPLANGGTIPLLASNSVVHLRTHELNLPAHPLLRAQLVDKDPNALDLERLFMLGTARKLRFIVTASNAYTHATTTKIAYYDLEQITQGRFRNTRGRAGLQIVTPAESHADHSPPKDITSTERAPDSSPRQPPSSERRSETHEVIERARVRE
jgi:hypothetical protein